MSLSPLARRLRLARQAKELTVEDVASALELTPGAIRHHENDQREPTLKVLQQYCSLYRVSADWLLYGRGKGPKDPEDLTDEALRTFHEIKKERQPQALDVLRALAEKKSA